MSRTSKDLFENGRLISGFDYTNQAWVLDGHYVNCGHPQPNEISQMTGRPMGLCGCYGRAHAGEMTV